MPKTDKLWDFKVILFIEEIIQKDGKAFHRIEENTFIQKDPISR